VTLPLHLARGPGSAPVYYVLTDTSDLGEAERLGINWAPKLSHALGTAAVQHATVRHGGGDASGLAVRVPGTVDFRPARVVVAGPDLFPLAAGTAPGSIGDRAYSPLFAGADGIVYNGPQIANATGRHDKLVAIDLAAMTATLRLTAGFYNGRDVLYLSTEASVPEIAALEAATFAPNLAAAPEVGSDDPARSAREAIIPVVNGPRGATNPACNRPSPARAIRSTSSARSPSAAFRPCRTPARRSSTARCGTSTPSRGPRPRSTPACARASPPTRTSRRCSPRDSSSTPRPTGRATPIPRSAGCAPPARSSTARRCSLRPRRSGGAWRGRVWRTRRRCSRRAVCWGRPRYPRGLPVGGRGRVIDVDEASSPGRPAGHQGV